MQKYLFLLQIFRNDHDKLEFTFESRHTVVLAMLMFLITKSIVSSVSYRKDVSEDSYCSTIVCLQLLGKPDLFLLFRLPRKCVSSKTTKTIHFSQ